jgi:hypothetical protein
VLLSAIAVFVVSSIVHMVLRYHVDDHRALPDENGVMEALSKFSIPPGDYAMPKAGSMAAMKDPAFLAKHRKGPVFMGTFMPPGEVNMGPQLLQWFVFSIVVSLFAAHVTGIAAGPGASSGRVFHVSAAVAFACYAMAEWPKSIWYKRALSTTIKHNFDGLLYALCTAGVFTWLWPK